MKTPNETCVLIVDDDPHLRDALALTVQRKGYQVLGAASGNEAAELVRHHEVDIVLSDIRMADGDGVELLRLLRERHPSKPPVIFVTGYADITPESAIAMGAHCVFHKPFDRMQMISELDRIIGYERKAKAS